MSDLEKVLTELRSAIAHLDQPLRLEGHPLVDRLPLVVQAPDVPRGYLLRRTLRRAIESLDPGPNASLSAPWARRYQVLYRYAIAKESMVGIAAELDISERQAYRDLHLALQSLACVLFSGDPAVDVAPAAASGTAARAAQVRQEVERLSGTRAQDVDISALLASVVETAQRLAREQETEIHLLDETPGLHIAANRVMLRQALLNLLSHLVRVPRGNRVVVHLSRSGEDALVRLSYRAARPHDRLAPEDPYAVAGQLLAALGCQWAYTGGDDGTAQIAVRIRLAQEHTVLVVDDNQGIISLLQSYLRGHSYRVHGTSEASQAMEMVEKLRPDAVILDVMMPDRDGWEVLQGLRASEAGRATRIIVCSIIKDPELAAALGADAFLHKPVDRASLLQTLDGLLPSTA